MNRTTEAPPRESYGKNTQGEIRVDEISVVDLFCGAGGLSAGMELAGFVSVLAIDSWDTACETFSSNHPAAVVWKHDLSAYTPEYLEEHPFPLQGDIGIVCGGPPCQGFSVAGRSLADDPRNFLYRNFLTICRFLRPRWIVMENVPALLKHETVSKSIITDFRNLTNDNSMKYDVVVRVVNAADYGVPQTRSRVCFIAKRGDVMVQNPFSSSYFFDPIFSRVTGLFGEPEYITAWDAISDLPEIEAGQGGEEMDYSGPCETSYQSFMRGELSVSDFFGAKGIDIGHYPSKFSTAKKVYNHLAQDHNETLVERFQNIPPGGSKADLARTRPDLLPPDGHDEQGLTYGRLWFDKPAATLPANFSRPSGNRSIHPKNSRLITPREAMRLSSFPDDYILRGGKVAQREQVGNAVPPLLAFHIARRIREVDPLL